MAQVVLDRVEKRYPNGVEAVRGIDLAVADGELVALVGPSGCGKTTTLRMIAGLEVVTRGTIAIGARVVNSLPPKDQNVAMVFQNHVLYPHMTAYDNMAFALRLRGRPKGQIDEAVRQAAAMLGLAGLLDRKPRQLSGGECQRVALGRAVVRKPTCFLLDEPLSNLDARLRIQLRAEIKRLHRRLRTTTIYVTHDQEDALTLGDRVAVMGEGRIHQVGMPEEVYRHPVNRFVAGFLGSAPMNFLDGTIAEHEGRLWHEAPGRRIAVPDWAAADLRAKVGAAVVLGVRPEAVRLDPPEGQAGNAIRAKVELVDVLGEVADVHVSTDDGARLVARLSGRVAPGAGALVQVHVDLDRVHFFEPDRDDREPGANLCLAAETHSDQTAR